MRGTTCVWWHRSSRQGAILLTGIVILGSAVSAAQAQYFGRNKVQYERMDFRILPTEHFDIYFYPAESVATVDAARMAERWYARHRAILRQDFMRNPLILYADQADFQQSNVIEGMIGQETGGVTEGIRDRVIMPFTGSYAEADHVLGHELVHVFQYRIAGAMPRGGANLNNIPLWLIEGMAEYLSLGRYDPNTAMWLRDALRRNDLPTINQLTTSGRYFPYRYGQALWAYIGGVWGDDAINRVYRQSLQAGWESALRSALGVSSDSLTKLWHAAIRQQYADVAQRTPPDRLGRSIIAGRSGEENVAPVLSPDGRFLAFYSSRGLFSIDLYLADASDGRVIRRLTSADRDPHFDALSFINSAGSFSPDGRQIAIVVYAKGNNEIHLINTASGRTERRIRVSGVGAIADPAWSPDGQRIAFSGMRGGISDLYVYELQSGRVRQLTNDREAQLQPTWSPDGRSLAFVTDQGPGTDLSELRYGPMRLAMIDVADASVRLLARGPGGKQINPQFTPDGSALYYVSDADGVSDIYRLTLANGQVQRLTNVATGVSGITGLSPTLSVARSTGTLAFSVFHDQRFAIRSMAADAMNAVVAAQRSDSSAGFLPPGRPERASLVSQALSSPREGLPAASVAERPPRRYRSGLSLDYIGGPSVGVAFGGGFGPAVGGGVALGFSDMLGNRNLGLVVNAPGNVRDIGADVMYLDRSRVWAWGAEAYHIPLASAFATAATGTSSIDGQQVPTTVYTQVIDRAYFDNAALLAQRALSVTRRYEFSAGVQRISFGTEVDSLYTVNGAVVREVSANVRGADALTLASASAAYVGDYSFFGFTSPISGGRYRFEVRPYVGSLMYQTLLADYRRYFFVRPLTFAIRGIHFGRYGGDAANSRLQPLFVGYPMLVRGYDAESFDPSECTRATGSNDQCPQFTRLNGSRLAVANAELRIPLFGTRQFGILNVPFLPLEVAPFVDAGVAWSAGQNPVWRFDRSTADRVPVVSSGVAGRLNVLGAAIVEVYWVRPYQRPGKRPYFGFQITPGW